MSYNGSLEEEGVPSPMGHNTDKLFSPGYASPSRYDLSPQHNSAEPIAINEPPEDYKFS